MLDSPLGRACLSVAAFGGVSASGVLINLAAFYCTIQLTGVVILAAVLGFVVSASWNFLLNRRFTFGRTGHLSRSVTVNLLVLASTVGLTSAAVQAGVEPLLAQAISIVLLAPVNYLLNSRWVFQAARV